LRSEANPRTPDSLGVGQPKGRSIAISRKFERPSAEIVPCSCIVEKANNTNGAKHTNGAKDRARSRTKSKTRRSHKRAKSGGLGVYLSPRRFRFRRPRHRSTPLLVRRHPFPSSSSSRRRSPRRRAQTELGRLQSGCQSSIKRPAPVSLELAACPHDGERDRDGAKWGGEDCGIMSARTHHEHHLLLLDPSGLQYLPRTGSRLWCGVLASSRLPASESESLGGIYSGGGLAQRSAAARNRRF